MPELTEQDFDRALTRSRRLRFIAGEFPSGKDIADLRAFVGLSQPQFASALGITSACTRSGAGSRAAAAPTARASPCSGSRHGTPR